VFALESPSTAGLVQHEVEQALLFWEPRITVLRVSVVPGGGGDLAYGDLRHEYDREIELETRRRFRALPHAKREERRRNALRAGVKSTGPAPTTLLPHEADAAILLEIAGELPSFDTWRAERRTRFAGPVLLITVDYVIKATNSRFNVVYPFYLERGTG